MYEFDASTLHLLLNYSDLFDAETLDLVLEIPKLNMHKTISIVIELIRAAEFQIDTEIYGIKCSISYEMSLKKMLFDMSGKSQNDPSFMRICNKKAHIISLQMLLIFLKKLIAYGNHSTLNQTDYIITDIDYCHIIKLQLIVAEGFDTEFEKQKGCTDSSHFIYGNYHLNNQLSDANALLRTYYMLERLSPDINAFEEKIRKEYRNYNQAFKTKYQYSICEFLGVTFFELTSYYMDRKPLTHASLWRNIASIYKEYSEVATPIIMGLSHYPTELKAWANKTENEPWDFSLFFEYPFFMDCKHDIISICHQTINNAFFEKIYWKIRECYSGEDIRSAMAFYGRLFEKYIQELTSEALKTSQAMLYIPEFIYGKCQNRSSDAYICRGDNLLVVEAKGFSILHSSLTQNIDISKNNKKLFVSPILQADARFSEIDAIGIDFQNILNVYIVSVTMDNISAVPEYVNCIHQDICAEKKSDKTKYFFNFSIEEYEMLMCLAESEVDIFNLLRDYFNLACITPFSGFLASHYQDKCPSYMTNFMRGIYQEATMATSHSILFPMLN